MAKTFTIHKQAFDDIVYFIRHDLKLAKKIFELMEDIQKTLFEGIGKPEPLKTAFERCLQQEDYRGAQISSSNYR